MQHDWKDTIFGAHFSPCSAETLVRTNHRLIAHSLSNTCQNNKNWLICIRSHSVLHQCGFLRHGVCMMFLMCITAPCGFWGCKNMACCISWLEVIKGIPNQDEVCFVSQGSFLCFSFVFRVCVVFCFLVFGCQYQCNQLPGKTCLQNDRWVGR